MLNTTRSRGKESTSAIGIASWWKPGKMTRGQAGEEVQ